MGVFGVYNVKNASSIIYYALHALQHRGQQGAGIVTCDKEDNDVFHRQKGLGLVHEIFNEKDLSELKGELGIGSVNYSNKSINGIENVLPVYFRHRSGNLAIANEGHLVNFPELQAYFEDKGVLFHTDTDSELLAQLIKKDNNPRARIYAIINALNMMEGGFTFVIMTKNRIYACRDKYGLKPLCVGKLGDGYVVSSESCAFDIIGATYIRDVEPGEILVMDHKGLHGEFYSQFKRHNMCSMEFIYYARPDSDIEGCNVHSYRKESGRRLYRECPADADIVVGVPDSSLSAAMGYAEESGIPYEMGLIKNKYIGRTFIEPTQDMRERGVKMKLSAIHSIVNGKRIVLVDDSIVRGTTCLKIIKLLRDAGATEVHVRIASPMMTHPCFYGVDTSTEEELLCSHRTLDEACQCIGADSLGYVSPQSTLESGLGRSQICMACFTGEYFTTLYSHEKKK